MNIVSSDNSVLINPLSGCDFDIKVNPTNFNFNLFKQDSGSISLSGLGLSSSKLTANLKLSVNPSNILSIDNTGLLALASDVENTDETVKITNTDTVAGYLNGKLLAGTNITLSIENTGSNEHLRISADSVMSSISRENTSSINLFGSGIIGTPLYGNVRLSATGGNVLQILSDGLFVPSVVETPLAVTDSTSIDLVTSGTNGHSLTAVSKISATSGNAITVNSDGLYAPALDSTRFIQNQEAVDQNANFRLRWGGGGAKMYWNGSSLILMSDDPSNIFIGYDAFSGSGGNNNIGLGTACHVNGSGNFNTAIGTKAGWQHIGNSSIFIGYGSGYTTNGNNNTIIGVSGGTLTTTTNSTLIGTATSAGDLLATSGSINNSHVVIEGGPTMGTFTSTKLNGLTSFITASGLSIADIVSFHVLFTGTAPLSDNGLGRTSEFYEKGEIVDADTIRLFMAHWADQGSGTFVVQAYANTTNVSVIGNGAHADKSNQVVLGDNNITQLRSNALKLKTNVTPTKGQILEFNGTEYVPSIITPQVLTYGTTTTWNLDLGRNAKLTLTGNATLSITGAIAGMCGIIKVIQDGTGSRTLTLPSGSLVGNGGGGAVVLTTTAAASDILAFYYDGTNYHWKKEPNYT